MKKIIDGILIFLMSLVFGIAMAAGAIVISTTMIWLLAMVLITACGMLVWKAILASIVLLFTLLFVRDGYNGVMKCLSIFKNVTHV